MGWWAEGGREVLSLVPGGGGEEAVVDDVGDRNCCLSEIVGCAPRTECEGGRGGGSKGKGKKKVVG